MTIHTRIGAALLALGALGLAGAAAADQLADIKAAGKITTATDMHYAPFDMLVDGTYQGMTKDLFDEVAKEIGVEPVYQDLPWTAQLPGLEVGKFDIVIAPVTITPERLERYTFTLPIADATVGLRPRGLQRRDQEARRHRRQDRRRPAGHRAVPPARGLWQEARRRDIKEYGTTDEAYADLAVGRLDAVAGSLAEPRLPRQAARRRLRADRSRDLRRAEVLRLGAAKDETARASPRRSTTRC